MNSFTAKCVTPGSFTRMPILPYGVPFEHRAWLCCLYQSAIPNRHIVLIDDDHFAALAAARKHEVRYVKELTRELILRGLMSVSGRWCELPPPPERQFSRLLKIACDPHLADSRVAVASCLGELLQRGTCWAKVSVDRIGERTTMSGRTVQRSIDDLVKGGLVREETGQHRATKYHLNFDVPIALGNDAVGG